MPEFGKHLRITKKEDEMSEVEGTTEQVKELENTPHRNPWDCPKCGTTTPLSGLDQ